LSSSDSQSSASRNKGDVVAPHMLESDRDLDCNPTTSLLQKGTCAPLQDQGLLINFWQMQ
jgi:hypothetical protein